MGLPRRGLYVDHTAVLAGGEIALLNLGRHLARARYTPVVALLADGPLGAELRKAGVETHIVAASRALLETRKDAVGAKSLLRAGAILSAIEPIVRLIGETKADLVHTNSLKSNLLGGIAARLAGRPVIWHIRDRIEKDYLPAAAVHLVRGAAKVIPSHVVANSRATLATVALDEPSSGSVIYSGLDLSALLAIEPRAGGPRRIGMIGRLTRWKGQHVFLEAAAAVHARFPEVRFQIVGGPLFGETKYEESLHRQAESLGIAGVTEFTGHRDDVPGLLAGMDVVVHA